MAITKRTPCIVDIIGVGDGNEILRESVRNGKCICTVDGEFGGASVTFGWLGKDGSFIAHNSTELPITANGAVGINHGDMQRLIVNVVGTSATTDLRVVSGIID